MGTRAFAALAVAGAVLASQAAYGFVEMEENDSIATANSFAGVGDVEGVRETAQDPDFFRFTGLDPELSYDASLDAPFLGIGWYDANGTLLDSVAFEGELVLEDLIPDESGELILSVCGHVPPDLSILDCSVAATGAGPYILTLPEPARGPLALAALAVLALLRRR